MSQEYAKRIEKFKEMLSHSGMDGALISSNINLFYFLGSMINGYLYIPCQGEPIVFVRKKTEAFSGCLVAESYKPEQIPALFSEFGITLPKSLGLEEEFISASEYLRLSKVFSGVTLGDVSSQIKLCRSVKTEFEIAQMRAAAAQQITAYQKIPQLFRKGMTDLEISYLVELELRKAGHLGIFRTAGFKMEAYIGSVLAGDNAAAASPFDFALGGAGVHPSLPVGANGTTLTQGICFMVDLSGNCGGYLSDLTRVFSVGNPSQQAADAHEVAIEVEQTVAAAAKPGANCGELYELGLSIVEKSAFADYFMGYTKKAKFIGHGLGLQINEPPVLFPGNKANLEAGNVIALEPKFVIPGYGAVGVEDTFVIHEDGAECITEMNRELVIL